MESSIKRRRELTGLLFQMEQWIALLVGMACLAVFLWAAGDGHKAFSIRHVSHFSTAALVSIGWFLTIVDGLSGVALMRFAFYKPSEPETDARPLSGRVSSGGSTENPNRFISTVAGKRRH